MQRLRSSVLLRSSRLWLSLIVVGSFLSKLPFVLAQHTVAYLADEYLYASLGRSLATHGEPLVRGSVTGMNALLTPILAAPAWRLGSLLGGADTGYRLVQLEGALAFSLAAVPVYLIGRQVGLRKATALAAALLAVCIPEGAYSSLLLTEPLAYPLLLTAVWAAIRSLERPTLARQGVFVLAAGAVAATRVQFFAVPLFYPVVLVISALARRQMRATLRAHLPLLSLYAAGALGVLALGPARLLGMYAGSASFIGSADPLRFAHWFGVDTALGFAAAGVVVIPGALIAAWYGLRAPARETERTLVLLTILVGGLGCAIAALYATAGYGNVQTRYSFYFAPLAIVLFCLWADHGRRRLWFALGGLPLIAAALAVIQPTHLAVGNAASGSAELFALHSFDTHLYGFAVGMADKQVLLALGLAVLLAAFALRKSTLTLPLTLVTAAALILPLQFGGFAYSQKIRPDAYLLASAAGQQLDRGTTGQSLFGHGASRTATLETLFLYPGLDHPVRLDGRGGDGLTSQTLVPAPDGTLRVAGAPLAAGPVLVFDEGSLFRFADPPRQTASSSVALLLDFAAPPRLSLVIDGYNRALRMLAGSGSIRLYGDRDRKGRLDGYLTLRIRSTVGPGHGAPVKLGLRLPDGSSRTVEVPVKGPRTLHLPICAATATVSFATISRNKHSFFGGGQVRSGEVVSARLDEARFHPDAAACAKTPLR